MAFRYEHADGPEFGHVVELSASEYEMVMKGLYLALERAVLNDSPDERDLTALLADLEPLLDD